MNCPSNILIDNNFVFVIIYTNVDYNFLKQIPRTQLFNLFRYEVTMFPKSDYRIKINVNAKWRILASNFLYKIKNKVVK